MNKIGFLVSFIIAFVIISCKSDSNSKGKNYPTEINKGGTLKAAISVPVTTINPRILYSIDGTQAASMIYEPIVKFNSKDLEIEPLIAESFEVKDSNRTFIFKIRKGIYFHDDACFENGKGRELTPKDIKYSYEYYSKEINGETAISFETIFDNNIIGLEDFVNEKAEEITGIQVEGNSVIIKLHNPNSDFLKQLSSISTSILAKEIVECGGLERGVGTGPFVLDSLNEKQVLFSKNMKYYLKDETGYQLPYLDTVILKIIPSKIDQLNAFENNEIHFIDGLPTSKIKYMVEENIRNFDTIPPKYILAHKPQLKVEYYGFNLTRPYFQDVRVRKAISYAIDREVIYDKVLRKQAFAPGTCGLVPPINLFKGYDFNEVEKHSYTYNPELAKTLFAEAGYPEGEGFPKITLEYNQNDINSKVAQEIQNQLKRVLNIDLQIETLPFDKMLDNANFARSDMYRTAWVGDYPSPQSMLVIGYGKNVPNTTLKASKPNSMRWVNPEFDLLYEKGTKAISKEERFKYFSEAEAIMMDEAPLVVLWYFEDNQILNSSVRNMNYNAIKYLDFRTVWLREWVKEEYEDYINQK